MAAGRIAVVNDDTAFLQLMHDLLTEEGYDPVICKEGDAAYELIKKRKPRLVILDIRMEHPDTGWMILECIRLASYAPNASNGQEWHWVVVDDPDLRRRCAEI